ncbi:phosphotransferase [Sandaracinus amylolyticus]|uniref:Aminoglycoside phosphotransferase family protein n=1 Tax=Sandaracinus amylolyticus TaxID=927083 RepID=A0A0F6VZV8_9BACT|nr:phosphotransferase [Sandaracinus amylolyticus]AKF03873.1 aminoglycoside phosphotransferase family protein [Sandaracinus amylolyticus]
MHDDPLERMPAGARITLLGEGTDFRAYDVDGRDVLRIPRHDGARDALLAEARWTAWLARRLPLPIPSYRHVVLSPRPFALYARLRGTPALRVALEQQDLAAIGARLGELLRVLHGLPLDPISGLQPDDDPTLAAWSAEALSDLRTAEQHGHHLDARWARELGSPPSVIAITPCVIHGDFAAEHVLLDEDAMPCGVIDWSDAVLGDPARDLAGLVHWGGAPMLASALQRYGSIDAATLERARWLATCRAVADVAFGAQRGRPEHVGAGLRALAHVASM